MHRLVCSGLARQGQTGRELLDAMSLDVLLDFALGEITVGLDPERTADLLRQIDDLDKEPEVVEITASDGRVVQLSPERIARIRANARGMTSFTHKKG